MQSNRLAIAVTALIVWGAIPAPALAQSTKASPSPNATATPAASEDTHPETGGFDPSKLSPEQQQALQLAIIKTSQNPVGNMTVFPFQNNFNYGVGRYTRYQYLLNIQPVFPIMLSQHWNLIARSIIPLLSQPSNAPPSVCASPPGCPWTTGLSDMQEQLFFAPRTKPGEFIWGAGPIFQFPTASPNTLGSGKWSTGPDAVGLIMPGCWVIGALVTQLWSFAGLPNRANVSSFLVQPFINYNIKGGWAISSAPIITANWASTQNKWTIPLGGGVAKTFKDNGQLMQLTVVYYTNVVRPLAAPQTTLRVTWSLLWPVKRGIDIRQLLQESK